MVKQVIAYQASDGSVHDTEFKANSHEALLALTKIAKEALNEAQIKWMLSRAPAIVDVLAPLVQSAREMIPEKA